MTTPNLIPFNEWSKERIRLGRKTCTSRHKKYKNDERVTLIERLSWGFIRNHLWREEGADTQEELQQVIELIYKRKVPDNEMFYVHFGDFR